MRLFRYFCFVFVLSLVFVGCSDKSKKKEAHEEIQGPMMTLEKRDTTEVYDMTKNFLELLKSNNIDKAVSMLYYLTPDKNVIPLPDSLAERQKAIFKRFPVLSYKIDSIIFYTETDSQVKYTIEFFKKQPGDPRPNTTSFFIKPMRIQGQWYITMFDSNTYNGGETKIKN